MSRVGGVAVVVAGAVVAVELLPPAENGGGAAAARAWEEVRAEIAGADPGAWTRDRFSGVSGVVLDESGGPAAGVEVAAVALEELFERTRRLEVSAAEVLAGWLPVEAVATSDEGGAFAFRGLAYGSKLLRMRRGSARASRELEIVYPGCGTEEADGSLREAPRRCVRVVSESGAPIQGVELVVLPPRWELGAETATTDADGRAEILTAAGSTLLARAPGRHGWLAGGVDLIEKDGELRLRADPRLRVHLRHEGSEQVELPAEPTDERAWRIRVARLEVEGVPPLELDVAADGSIDLGPLPPGRYGVELIRGDGSLAGAAVIDHPGAREGATSLGDGTPSPGLGAADRAPDRVAAGCATTFGIEVDRPARLRVVRADGGPFVADVRLAGARAPREELLRPASALARIAAIRAHVRSDSGAPCALALPAGRWVLDPHEVEIELGAGEEREVVLPAAPPPTVLRTLRPGSLIEVDAAGGRRVLLSSMSREARLADGFPGFCEAVAIGPKGERSLPRGFLHGRGAEIWFDGSDAAAPGLASVRGFVLDERGEPVAAAEVFLQSVDPDWRELRRATTDAHGWFRIDRLRPGLAVALSARRSGDGGTLGEPRFLAVASDGSRCDLVLAPTTTEGAP